MPEFKPYSDDEREALARERLGKLMQAIGQLDAAKTYLLIAWGQLGAAGALRDRERIQEIVRNLHSDVSDVADAAQRFCATFDEVLEAIAAEYNVR